MGRLLLFSIVVLILSLTIALIMGLVALFNISPWCLLPIAISALAVGFIGAADGVTPRTK